jgi:hypothetical protein
MKKENGKKYINKQERIGGVFYVLLLFCIGAGLCSWSLLSYSDSISVISRKNAVITKMERQSEFRQSQARFVIMCDSLVRQIDRYNFGINAIYEENDIKYLLNEIKQPFEKNPIDRRYKVFDVLGSVYEMWFTDRKQLWSKKENVELFRRNLEQCELGLSNAINMR